MPPSYVLPHTNPRITLDIHTPLDQKTILPLSFTGAIIDGLQYLLLHVIDLGHNVPIPAEGAFFAVGRMSVVATSANEAAGDVLDCFTLGLVLNRIWSLVTRHGYRTWDFDVLRGGPVAQVRKIGTVSILYTPNDLSETKKFGEKSNSRVSNAR